MKKSTLKFFIFSTCVFNLFNLNAQMKVGNNPTTIHANSNVQVQSTAGNQFTITRDSSRVGIGTLTPTNPLHILSTANPLRIEGLQSGNMTSDSILVTDTNGVVKRISLSSGVDNSVGGISIFPYTALPAGYLECNGQAVSRTTYALLFAKIGTTYGAGNGSTTFNLPDLRGEFVRGWDNGRGIDAGRTIGSSQAATAIAESIGIWTQSTGNVGSSQVVNNGEAKTLASGYSSFSNSSWANTWQGTYFNQVRPRNVAMVYAMKALPSINFSGGGGSSTSSNTEPWYSTTTNTGATSNTENIYQMGKVGIGTSNPVWNLDVQTSTNTSTLTAQFVNTGGTTTTESQIAVGGGPGAWSKIVGYNGTLGIRNYTTGTEILTIKNGNGNVGIGITAPTAKLEVDGSLSTKISTGVGSIRMSPGTSGNSGILEFFNSNGTTRAGYIGWANNGNLLYTSENDNKHYFQGGSIYVQGSNNYTTSGFAYYGNSVWGTGTHGLFTGVSQGQHIYGIYCENRIATVELNVYSDKRIKNILGTSNASKDLATLMKLSIKDYTMKDFIQNGNRQYKKVIAQEVEEVFPQAISQSSNFIPNIFAPAKTQVEENYIDLLLPKAHEIKVNDTLKVYFAGKEKQIQVLATPNNKTIRIANKDIDLASLKDVFVYGQYVNDFRTVDYDALSMLNISATQELYRKIEALEKQNQQLLQLQSGFETLKAEIQNIKKDMNKDLSLKSH